jgi:hypothetical protein
MADRRDLPLSTSEVSMQVIRSVSSSLAMVLCLILAGCSGKPAPAPVSHKHVHGPHDGELIELGNEEYHAELVVDDANGLVTIYILDKEGKKPVPIDEKTISIKFAPNQAEFALTAKPQEGDSGEKASRFESGDKALGIALDNPDAERELHVKVGNHPYVEKIPHFEDEHHHAEKK